MEGADVSGEGGGGGMTDEPQRLAFVHVGIPAEPRGCDARPEGLEVCIYGGYKLNSSYSRVRKARESIRRSVFYILFTGIVYFLPRHAFDSGG